LLCAHIEDVHAIVEGITEMLAPDGVFVSESHHLIGPLDDLQYDTVYHEHLRYYSVGSLAHLAEMRGLEVSTRERFQLTADRSGFMRRVRAHMPSNPASADVECRAAGAAMRKRLADFRQDVMLSKLRLHALIRDIKENGGLICGIRAPSRASTLVNYVGLDSAIIDYVREIEGSRRSANACRAIPAVEESRIFADQPDCAIISSWHIASELAPKLRAKGFKGKLVTPLPVPRFL
jgi:hypothetical protein